MNKNEYDNQPSSWKLDKFLDCMDASSWERGYWNLKVREKTYVFNETKLIPWEDLNQTKLLENKARENEKVWERYDKILGACLQESNKRENLAELINLTADYKLYLLLCAFKIEIKG